MPRRLLLFFVCIGVWFLFAQKADVYSIGCGANISPSEVLTGTSPTLTYQVTNEGPETATTAKIVNTGSGVFTILSGSASGWSAAVDGDTITYTGGSLAPDASATFSFVVSALSESDPVTFDLSLSENGADYFQCGGSGEVTSSLSAPQPPVISGVSLSIGSTSVTVSWSTDVEATSTVNYGTTGDYGSSKSSDTAGTSHSFTLESLTASTVYYYKLTSTNGVGTRESNQATFTTGAAGTTTTVTTTSTVTSTVQTIVTKVLKDSSSPTVSIKTDFSKPFLEAPTMTGTSTDGGEVNAGLASVEYSLDGGKNWLPVDDITGLGTKSVSFEFTPSRLDDGNYIIKMRAKDLTGNIGLSKPYTLIIDRLPPQVGGSLFSLGPMILRPDAGGNIYSIAGLPIKVILSAVGGPTTMDLSYGSQNFSLIKNIESGLWSSLININTPGNFTLKVNSIDGAENKTERSLSSVVALSPGKVTDEKNQPVFKAKVSVFTFEKAITDFSLWEAEPFMQSNPQETGQNGEYRYILPAGKYYLEIEAAGKRKQRTEIFEIDSTTPLNQIFSLTKSIFLGNLWSKTVPINLAKLQSPSSKTDLLIGHPLPDFDLSVSSSVFSNTSILGKPTVITFISSWEPQTSDQLLALDKFKTVNEGVNVYAVTVQESVSKTDIFKKTGGYQLPIFADPDGTLVLPLSLESLPTHLIVDRKGIIKEVITGFTNENNLLNSVLK